MTRSSGSMPRPPPAAARTSRSASSPIAFSNGLIVAGEVANVVTNAKVSAGLSRKAGLRPGTTVVTLPKALGRVRLASLRFAPSVISVAYAPAISARCTLVGSAMSSFGSVLMRSNASLAASSLWAPSRSSYAPAAAASMRPKASAREFSLSCRCSW